MARTAATAGEIAVVAALPVGLLVLAAIVLLGPPLGAAFFEPGTARFWPALGVFPEPAEHARYLLALLGPVLLAGVVVLARRRAPMRPGWLRSAVLVAEALLLAFALFGLISPHLVTYEGIITALAGDSAHRVFFTLRTLVVAVAIVGLLVAALHSERVVGAVRRAVARETRTQRVVVFALATLYVAIWMLTGFNTEGSTATAFTAAIENIPFWLNETFALLNGSHPLADFHAQYAQLWPYVTAATMKLFGTTLTVYAAVTVVATTLAMLAVYAIFRRVARSSLLALALFLPFVATSFFKEEGTFDNRYAPTNLYSLFPMRYGGPFVLAWLLARQLDGRGPRSRTLLFLFAGLVVINNPEFGAAALAATFAALVVTLPQLDVRQLARLAGAAALGGLAAVVAVSALTLVAAGTLPHFDQLLEFSRIYGSEGFGMLPMPTIGLHMAIYLTFAGALVLAVVRAVERAQDRVLTGLLCWIGVFGFGAGGYFVGRSHPEVLIDVFSPWAIALALLLVAAVPAILARQRRLPRPLELAVLAGCALAVCSIAQTPTPWSQIERLSKSTPAPEFKPVAAERFVGRFTERGDRVVIMVQMNHRVAYDLGIENAFPYAHTGSLLTLEQWDSIDRMMLDEGIHSLFVSTGELPERAQSYLDSGFRLVAIDRERRFALLRR